MNWEQKLEALQAINPNRWIHLRMRTPGDWYVEARMSIGGNGMLCGAAGNGRTPEAAVNDHWDNYVTHLPSDRHVYAGGKRVRWNGFMWQEVSP